MDVIICYSINILGINLVGENKMEITRERMTRNELLNHMKTDNVVKKMYLDLIESNCKALREDSNAGLEEVLHVIEGNLQAIEEIVKG